MSTASPTATRHHPSWREVREGFLADPEVQASYQELAPSFCSGASVDCLARAAGLETGQVEPKLDTLSTSMLPI